MKISQNQSQEATPPLNRHQKRRPLQPLLILAAPSQTRTPFRFLGRAIGNKIASSKTADLLSDDKPDLTKQVYEQQVQARHLAAVANTTMYTRVRPLAVDHPEQFKIQALAVAGPLAKIQLESKFFDNLHKLLKIR